MLSSIKHEISTVIKGKMVKNKHFPCLKTRIYVVFILLIFVKMPTVVGILTFMSRINLMIHENEKKFITSGPGLCWLWKMN